MTAAPSPNALAALLLPELQSELAQTRRVLERVPESWQQFQLHPRSRSLASLAGHTADLVSFIAPVFTRRDFDFGTEHRSPLVMQSSSQLLSSFDESTAQAIEALKNLADTALLEQFQYLFNGRVVFAGNRYTAYRTSTLNHIIHHRAQLGYYLRALDIKVPALYGPSADEFPK